MSWKAGQPLRLETENYVLRTLTKDDLTDRMVSWFSDPEVMKFVDMPLNLSNEQVSAFISGFNNKTSFCLGIFDAKTRIFVGFFQIYRLLDLQSARTSVVVGEKDYWGTGLVVETRAKILDFLFDTLRLHKVFGAVFTRNLPAVFNYKTQGFRSEGVLKEDYPARDGGWHDVYRFAMLDHEWAAIKKAQENE